MTMNIEQFKEYYKRLDERIAESSKEDLAECARLLALNVVHYKQKYGELPDLPPKKWTVIYVASFSGEDHGLPLRVIPRINSNVRLR